MTASRILVAARVLAVVSLVVLLQVSFVSQTEVAGVRPDIVLLLAACAGVVAGPDRGAIVGFLAGLGYDVFLWTPLGLTALVLTVVAYVVGSLQLPMASPPPGWRWASVVGASAAGVVLWILSAAVLGEETVLQLPWLRLVVVVALVNGLIAVPALRLVGWVFAPSRSRGVGDGAAGGTTSAATRAARGAARDGMSA